MSEDFEKFQENERLVQEGLSSFFDRMNAGGGRQYLEI